MNKKQLFEALDEYVEHVDELLMLLDYLLEAYKLSNVVRSDFEALVGVRESIVAAFGMRSVARESDGSGYTLDFGG